MPDVIAKDQKCKLYKDRKLYDDKAVCDIELTHRSPGGWITSSKPLNDSDTLDVFASQNVVEYTLVLNRPLRGYKYFRIRISRIEKGKKSGAFDVLNYP